MSRARSGFTLLEMLVAIALMALVVGGAIQLFEQVRAAYARSRGADSRSLTADVILDRIESELVGTLLLVKPEDTDRLAFPWVFVSEDRVFGADDSDGLRFVTLSPARLPGATLTGPRMVSYSVEPGPGVGLDLVRQEERLPEQLDKVVRTDEGQVVAEDVARFSLRFRDPSGEWVDAWDSTDLAMLDGLPESVELAVQLFERDADGELQAGSERSRVVELPVRPVDLTGADGEVQECPDGPTVDECLAEFQPEIEALDPGRQQLLASARPGSGPCWHEPDPGPRQLKLFEYFQRFVGLDPFEVCR